MENWLSSDLGALADGECRWLAQESNGAKVAYECCSHPGKGAELVLFLKLRRLIGELTPLCDIEERR